MLQCQKNFVYPYNSAYGLCRDKVAACAKHFVGDGGTHNGINENNTIIDEHGLLSIHMPPYYDSIIKGVATIMVSYSSLNGVKMHANHDLVTGYLKSKLHFRVSNNLQLSLHYFSVIKKNFIMHIGGPQGFVISDWLGIDRITSPPGANYTYSVQAGINAGIDMVCEFLLRKLFLAFILAAAYMID